MRGKHLTLLGRLMLTASLAGFAVPSLAAETIAARAGGHPDFDRVVFDWPRATSYSVHRDGGKVSIDFGGAADVKFNGFDHLTRAQGFTAATGKDGRLTVSFDIDAGASLKDFTSGNSVVLDIAGPAATVATVRPQPAAQEPPRQKAAQEAAPQPPARPAPDGKTGAAPDTAAATKPTAGKDAVQPATQATETALPAKAEAAPKPAAEPAAAKPATEAAQPQPAGPEAAAKPEKPPEPPATTDAKTTGPAPNATPAAPVEKIDALSSLAPPAAKPAGPAAPQLVIGNTPLLVASFDPKIELHAAIWQRGGYGYIMFGRRLGLSIGDITSGQPAPLLPLEPIDLDKTSGFRFPLPADAQVQATRDGDVWKIFLVRQQPDVPVSANLVAQPDFALGARFLLPLPEAAALPVPFTDPVAGDALYLVPLTQTEAFSVERHMSDFWILPAAQGLVIKPMTDKLLVRPVSDGIEITAEGGLKLSPATDTGSSQQSSQKARETAAGKSLFDFAAWRGKPGETFSETRQRLQQTIVDVPERERDRARLELARFYFANGNGAEAEALLEWLARLIPDLALHNDFLALSGASLILAHRPDEGLKKIDQLSASGQPEIDLWQAVAEAELRHWPVAEEKFSVSENVLSGYPEPFRSRFMALAIEAAVAADKVNEASDWLDQLESNPHNPRLDAAIAYLHGVLHAKAGRATAAEEAWKVSAASDDQLYKVRAELALVDLGVATGSMTPAQAADRLEALRFAWRGDDLEVDILHRLGQFYVQGKNVKSGLNTLSQAVQLYPDSPMTPDIRKEMSQIFHDIYLGDLGKKMSPLDALTLYQQYKDLMPTGAEGIAVTRNLAERLVAIDLLGQAGDLLEGLVKNQLSGTDKDRADTRLAAIRLLDRRPDDAIAALDFAKGDTFTPDQQNERMLLRAKALSELNRDDDALALLKGNDSKSGKLLRADISIHAQKWADAATALLDLIGEPPKAGRALNNDQPEWLVNCAIALSMEGDQAGLDKLAIDFGAAMAGTPQNDAFRILTQPDKTGELKDISAAQSRLSDVNMFQGFLDNYRKTDANGAAPDTAAKPETAPP